MCMLFVSVTQINPSHALSPITGSEGSACNRFPVHAGNLYMLQYIQVHSTTPAANSHYGDFSDGVCCVVKITAAESTPDTELLTQYTFCFSSNVPLWLEKRGIQ